MKAGSLIVRTTKLLPAEKNVTAHWALYPSFEASALIEQHDSNPSLCARRQKGRTAAHVPEKNNSLKHMERDAHRLSAVDTH